MLTFLKNILEVLTNIPAYILYAIETMINLFFTAVEGLFSLTQLLLPELPEVSPPEYITEINWFFPVGAIISIATPLVSAYVIWLSIKWIYKKMGDV